MYMRRKSVVRAKNTRNKHVFAQVKLNVMQDVILYYIYYAVTPIFPNRSETFMFLITMLRCQTCWRQYFFNLNSLDGS